MLWAGLAIVALMIVIAWGWRDTGEYIGVNLHYIVDHLSDSEDEKILHQWGNDAAMRVRFDLKRMTPDDAVIGIPRSGGRFGLQFLGLLYPRRVVIVDSLEAFERAQPTHVLLDGGFPPYTFPHDPRPQRGSQATTALEVVRVRGPGAGSSQGFPHGWMRVPTILVEALSPMALGMGLLLLIRPQWSSGRLYFLALAFLVGLGAHTLLLFGLSLAGVPLTSMVVFVVNGLLLVTGLIIASRRGDLLWSMRSGDSPDPLPAKQLTVFMLLSVLLLSHLAMNLYWPAYHFDAVVSYDYRAKAIAQQGTVAIWQFSGGLFREQVNFYYPFFLTMLHAHHYLLGGLHPKVYGTLILGAFLIIFYAALRTRGSSPFQALMFTAMLSGNLAVVVLAENATLNFPQMVYGTVGLLFVLDYIERREAATLLLSGLCLGFAGWIRTDSVVHLTIACLVIVLGGRLTLRSRVWGLGVLIGCYGLITLPYEYFIRVVVRYDVAAYYRLSVENLLDLRRLWTVLTFFVKDSLAPQTGYLGLPWLLVITADWPWRKDVRPLFLVTGLMVVAWIGLFSAIDPPGRDLLMGMSALRWYVNLTPLYLLSIAQTDLMRRVFDVLEGRVPMRLRLEL